MSQPRPDLRNDEAAMQDLLAWLIRNVPQLCAVYLFGSRSPLSSREPKPTSDWDFAVVTNAANLKLPHLRNTMQLHADCIVVHKSIEADWLAIKPAVAQVWPNNETELFNDYEPNSVD